MTSVEHDQMVAEIVTSGLRSPEVLPSADAFRALRAAEGAAPAPLDGFTVSEIEVNGVPALSVTAQGTSPTSTVLYFHGGGYIWMTPQSHLPVLAALARATGGRVVGPHYRRAPEHPFPAAVEDAVAAYRWLLDEGNDPGDIAFAGDSAGGGLVLAALVALRRGDVPLPAAAACFSPWTDLAVTGASADTADDPVVSGDSLRMMAGTYLDGADARGALASPLYADLTGLPPLQIQVGTRESLLDDARRVADRARAAGVDVTCIEHPGVVHMWIVFRPEIPESKEAYALLGSFLSRHLTGG